MERRIDLRNLDLDEASEEIDRRRSAWSTTGLKAHPVSWMDIDADWPRPLVKDRASVLRPMSLGLRIESSGIGEAEIVLYAGGWADVTYGRVSDKEPVVEYVELDSADEFGPLLDRVVGTLIPRNQ